MKLLGDVQVVRSLAEKKKGPKFYVHAKRNPLEAEVNNYDISINHYVIYHLKARWPHGYCAQLRVERSGFKPCGGRCVVFLGKTDFTRTMLLFTRLIGSAGRGHPTIEYQSIQGGIELLRLVASCFRILTLTLTLRSQS